MAYTTQSFGPNSARILRSTCIPDVALPSVISNSDLLNYLNTFTVTSSVDLVNLSKEFSAVTPNVAAAETKSAAEPFLKQIQKIFINYAVPHRNLLPDDYEFFGPDDNIKNLQTFISSNPFLTNAISFKGDGTYAIESVPEDDGESSLYSTLISFLSDEYPRINGTFRLGPNGEIEVLHLKEIGGECGDFQCAKSNEEKAGDLLFLVLFFAQSVHSIIHVFHYLNIITMADSCKKYPEMRAWALPFLQNISLKYTEVYNLLLPPTGGGVLNGGGPYRWKDGEGLKVNNILREVLCEWGSYKTADEFVQKFIFKNFPADKIEESGLLVQFRKHAGLISNYATDLCEVFREVNQVEYHAVNKHIQLVLSQCGDNVSEISDIHTWVELMSVTGLLHGNTLSYTRAFATGQLLSRFNPNGVAYTEEEADYISTNLLTITGAMEDRHVFASGLSTITAPEKKSFLGLLVGLIVSLFSFFFLKARSTVATESLNPLAKSVLLRYDAQSTALKESYYKSICSGDKEYFKSAGWIISDYFLDGTDGKQLTIATYI